MIDIFVSMWPVFTCMSAVPVLDAKGEHKKALEEQMKAIEDNLNDKHSVELQKKDIEIEKLKDTIEQLHQHKTATRRTKKEE